MMLTGIIIGITFWILGILIFISDYSKVRRCSDKATAIIVDVIKEEHWKYRKHGSGYETNYYPVIEFVVGDKKYRVKTGIKAYHSDTYKKGTELDEFEWEEDLEAEQFNERYNKDSNDNNYDEYFDENSLENMKKAKFLSSKTFDSITS